MMRIAVLLLLCVSPACGEGPARFEKLIEVLNELHGSLTQRQSADVQANETAYGAVAGDGGSLDILTSAIAQAKSDIAAETELLHTAVEELAGHEVAVKYQTAHAAKLKEEIDATQAEIDTLTSEKLTKEADLEESISALDSAVELLNTAHGQITGDAAEADLLSVTARVKKAMQSRGVSAEDEKKVESFLGHRVSALQVKLRGTSKDFPVTEGKYNKYQPQSGYILGILKQMHKEFVADLGTLRTTFDHHCGAEGTLTVKLSQATSARNAIVGGGDVEEGTLPAAKADVHQKKIDVANYKETIAGLKSDLAADEAAKQEQEAFLRKLSATMRYNAHHLAMEIKGVEDAILALGGEVTGAGAAFAQKAHKRMAHKATSFMQIAQTLINKHRMAEQPTGLMDENGLTVLTQMAQTLIDDGKQTAAQIIQNIEACKDALHTLALKNTTAAGIAASAAAKILHYSSMNEILGDSRAAKVNQSGTCNETKHNMSGEFDFAVADAKSEEADLDAEARMLVMARVHVQSLGLVQVDRAPTDFGEPATPLDKYKGASAKFAIVITVIQQLQDAIVIDKKELASYVKALTKNYQSAIAALDEHEKTLSEEIASLDGQMTANGVAIAREEKTKELAEAKCESLTEIYEEQQIQCDYLEGNKTTALEEANKDQEYGAKVVALVNSITKS